MKTKENQEIVLDMLNFQISMYEEKLEYKKDDARRKLKQAREEIEQAERDIEHNRFNMSNVDGRRIREAALLFTELEGIQNMIRELKPIRDKLNK